MADIVRVMGRKPLIESLVESMKSSHEPVVFHNGLYDSKSRSLLIIDSGNGQFVVDKPQDAWRYSKKKQLSFYPAGFAKLSRPHVYEADNNQGSNISVKVSYSGDPGNIRSLVERAIEGVHLPNTSLRLEESESLAGLKVFLGNYSPINDPISRKRSYLHVEFGNMAPETVGEFLKSDELVMALGYNVISHQRRKTLGISKKNAHVLA
jgi:hypothetical protein